MKPSPVQFPRGIVPQRHVTNITHPVCVDAEPLAVMFSTGACDIGHNALAATPPESSPCNQNCWLSPVFRGILVSRVPQPGILLPLSVSVHTVRREIEPEPSLGPRRPILLPSKDPERKKKRLLLALAVLLVALIAVFLKNWDFWFPTANQMESASDTFVGKVRKVPPPDTSAPAVAEPSGAARDHKTSKTANATSSTMASTTDRAALPDLQVEVMAGNQRKQLPAKNNNAIRVDLSSSSSTPGTQVRPEDMISSSASHAQVSEQTAQTVNRPVAPDYPLLARQMRVQGAVILQALISKEGTIQELQILSGPAILANAAREAVRQWHFKPYLQEGQPIETQARITVNFTISTN